MTDNETEYDEGMFYPVGEHPEEIWERLYLLHWAEMGGRNTVTAVMQHDTLPLWVLQKVNAEQIREFFGEWDGDPKK